MLGLHAFAACARNLNVWLLIGSLALKGENGNLVNRSLLFAPNGDRVAAYDKIHLFDVDLPTGERIRESEAYAGRWRCVRRLDAMGRSRSDHLLRCPVSRSLPAIGPAGCGLPYGALGLHGADR